MVVGIGADSGEKDEIRKYLAFFLWLEMSRVLNDFGL